MRRLQRLNIGNTQLSANLNFYDTNDYDYVECLEDLYKCDNSKRIILDYDKLQFTSMVKALSEIETDNFTILTSKPIPIQLMTELSYNSHTLLVYKIKQRLSDELLKDIQQYAKILSVGVYIEVPNKDFTPKDILYALNDIPIILDRVYLYVHEKYSLDKRLRYYNLLHSVLAGWKMQLHINAHNSEQAEFLDEYEGWV